MESRRPKGQLQSWDKIKGLAARRHRSKVKILLWAFCVPAISFCLWCLGAKVNWLIISRVTGQVKIFVIVVDILWKDLHMPYQIIQLYSKVWGDRWGVDHLEIFSPREVGRVGGKGGRTRAALFCLQADGFLSLKEELWKNGHKRWSHRELCLLFSSLALLFLHGFVRAQLSGLCCEWVSAWTRGQKAQWALIQYGSRIHLPTSTTKQPCNISNKKKNRHTV